ncbi:MAG: LysR family transcriptional regulator [Klebsiella sp.]|uniref:helix-turn-helix domain-containing protein n=1 Tax=Klebsiella sp. TaxID=576 RepID=UPI0039E6191B
MIDDIRYLIVFAKIVESGSVSGGAAVLGLSTATASAHLSWLEKNLNSALLYNTPITYHHCVSGSCVHGL